MVAKGLFFFFFFNVSYCKKPALFSFPKRKYLILTVFISAKQSVNYYLLYLLKYSVDGNGCVTELYFLW